VQALPELALPVQVPAQAQVLQMSGRQALVPHRPQERVLVRVPVPERAVPIRVLERQRFCELQ